MAAKPGASTIQRAWKLSSKEDLFKVLKTCASRPEFYAPSIQEIGEALQSKDLESMGLNEEEMVVATEGIKSITEHGYVHPKIGALLRLFEKEQKGDASETMAEEE